MATMNWHPKWWNAQTHGTAWERTREALRRDWEQTKFDLGAGGHEMNQSVNDTVKQAQGKAAIPPIDTLNPPKIIGSWDDVALPIEYGHAAHQEYGSTFTAWNETLEEQLRSDWQADAASTHAPWEDVREHVRRGYEYARTKP